MTAKDLLLEKYLEHDYAVLVEKCKGELATPKEALREILRQEILVMPWVDRMRLYGELCAEEAISKHAGQLIAFGTGTDSNLLAGIEIDCSAPAATEEK